jgi:hypothetical protein
MGPFDLTSPEAPEKDFVVHNPALLNHFDGGLFGRIKADEDAHEKVFLRTWYVPDYPEPRGWIWDFAPRPKFTNPLGEIVNEYTYMFIDDTTLDPTHGSYDRTDIVFPMAGLGGQVGLDRYDVNGDGTDEIMSVELITQRDRDPSVCEPWFPTTMGDIVVAPQAIDAGNMKLVEGGQIEFFDYMIKLVGTSTMELKADLEVWYTGQGYNNPLFIDNITLWQEVANAAVVDAGQWDVNVSFDRHFDTIPIESAWPGEGMVPVDRPFGFLVTYVGEDYVSLTPYRFLSTGESIWVDGAEYDVSAIGIVPGDQPATHFDCDLAELKYITIRNPLPKGTGSIYLPEYTVWKARFGRMQPLPVLPPFNMMHDMVDDVNIPDCFSGVPDQQWEDNYNGGVAPCGPPDYLHNSYDFIAERIVEDQKPLVFWWFREEKEPRFDTNLTEEKFTKWEDWKEKWMWINIETMPWHFTEFVLPEWPEAPGLENLGYIGDYILVSSFITEDGVRVKFSYDASDGTGLYVNSDLCEPARVLDVTSNSVVQQYADVMLKGVVENADTFAWDFGGLTGCTGADTLTPTCSGDVAGAFEVTLTVKNECAEHTLATIVVVEPCPGDFAAPFGFRDLADIMAMLPAWNSDLGDAEYDEMFDFDDDGHVGLYDIMQVVAVWNTECPGGMP